MITHDGLLMQIAIDEFVVVFWCRPSLFFWCNITKCLHIENLNSWREKNNVWPSYKVIVCVLFFKPYTCFFSTGLMSVPRDANLSELVVAERAVATKSRKNVQAKCTTIKLLFKAQLHLLWWSENNWESSHAILNFLSSHPSMASEISGSQTVGKWMSSGKLLSHFFPLHLPPFCRFSLQSRNMEQDLLLITVGPLLPSSCTAFFHTGISLFCSDHMTRMDWPWQNIETEELGKDLSIQISIIQTQLTKLQNSHIISFKKYPYNVDTSLMYTTELNLYLIISDIIVPLQIGMIIMETRL